MPNWNTRQPNSEFWIESIKIVGLSFFLALGIRTFAAGAFFIPSSSMKPTLGINDRLIVSKLSYEFDNPLRGDIVVFNPPNVVQQEEKSSDPFIKRIVGLPGDQIEVKSGRVYINSCLVRENYIAERPDYSYGPVTVPPDSYLVLGDNRNNSYDSHYWGFVPRDRIVGKAVYRFWPLSRIGGLNQHPIFLCSSKKG